jgi:hypothetical protein
MNKRNNKHNINQELPGFIPGNVDSFKTCRSTLKVIEIDSEGAVIRIFNDFTKCPFCGKEVIKYEIHKHISHCQNQNKSTSKSRKKKKEIGKINNAQRSSHQDFRKERYLDGTRNFNIFRENGRFGSASSYDNMDDESFS